MWSFFSSFPRWKSQAKLSIIITREWNHCQQLECTISRKGVETLEISILKPSFLKKAILSWEPSGTGWTLHYLEFPQHGVTTATLHTHCMAQASLRYRWRMPLLRYMHTQEQTHTYLKVIKENTSEFISFRAISISFCLQRWLVRMPSCNFLAFCSLESCLWASFRSSTT